VLASITLCLHLPQNDASKLEKAERQQAHDAVEAAEEAARVKKAEADARPKTPPPEKKEIDWGSLDKVQDRAIEFFLRLA